ncbi:DUF6377 domain-containing protein [Parabacteroides sp. Marseille-P3160]|uniref:DUF6377 domain-containing protein n=1 Tax=Parabacteroides sp. Marseille-P3160 TaxID=1917887 RepID=UPI0011185E88|nr:DUF6377 domain-containing protein [Parabacteroides sp. Marseille-P3160]
MVKICILAIFFGFSFSLFGQTVEVDSLLNELDALILDDHIYMEKKFKRIDSIKAHIDPPNIRLTDNKKGRKLYHIYANLFDEYKSFQTDSALVYAQKKLELAEALGDDPLKSDASMNVAEIMIITGMYKEASDLLALPYIEHAGYYYHLQHTLNEAMADFTILKPDKEKYLKKADFFRDSLLLMTTDSNTYTMILADKLSYKGNYREALELIMDIFPTHTTNDRFMGYLAYAIADIYERMGNREKEKYFLALSAISDIKSSVKENMSLRMLSILLYKEKEIKRSYNYLRFSLEDATFCNARQRTLQISEALPIIEKANQDKMRKQQEEIKMGLFAISILSLLLLILLVYIRIQMNALARTKKELSSTNLQLNNLNLELKRLNENLNHSNAQLQDANIRLSQTNKHLKESDLVKESYLGKFINLCSVYIDKLDAYRKGLNRIAMTGKIEELYKTLKSSLLVEEELKEFYAVFDDTFLRIFPTFIDDFNQLFEEKDRQEPKPGELLTTELRIFALIRLGINDSSIIANFLRYSITTIYTYRSKLRNKSVYRDEFEEKIMKIGIK